MHEGLYRQKEGTDRLEWLEHVYSEAKKPHVLLRHIVLAILHMIITDIKNARKFREQELKKEADVEHRTNENTA